MSHSSTSMPFVSARASRSAVLHSAIGMLRIAALESAHAEAWEDWASSDDAERWNEAAADGIADAPR
jgi:hypothetical protein